MAFMLVRVAITGKMYHAPKLLGGVIVVDNV